MKSIKKYFDNFKSIIKYYVFIINLFILIFNLYNFMHHLLSNYSFKKILIKENLLFKFSDYFSIKLSELTYKEISKYLNQKYHNKNLLFNNTNIIKNKKLNKTKKIIKIQCTDLFGGQIKYIKNYIKDDNYIIKFDTNNPDYLIFNKFGRKHLNPKYKNAIKIAFYTENKIPNLNEVDYAIGHQHINYLDRYFKYSIFLKRNFQNIKKIRENVLKNPIRTKFCAAVISNSNSFFRNKFINELNKYKQIDMGGKYNNNIGKRVINKTEFLSSYKFSIAMENSNSDGYITEKIVHAFKSGTIPIYYGDYMIDEYINPKSFILIKGEKDIKQKIEYIKEIDNNDEKYRNILKENVIINNNISNIIDKELKKFFIHIFEQEKIKAYRTTN